MGDNIWYYGIKRRIFAPALREKHGGVLEIRAEKKSFEKRCEDIW